MANLLPLAGSALLAAGTTALLTALVRHWTIRRAILDHPNERSSHSRPTPRGAGIAVAFVILGWLFVAGMTQTLPWKTVIALGGGGIVIAGVGWVDDVRSLDAIWRLISHFIAAAWTVAWLGGMPRVAVGDSFLILGLLGSAVAVIGIVWAINLFNFMDGIDGIAGIEALCVGAFGGAFLAVNNAAGLAQVSFVVAGAALGFLVWNWPPAKIFLGDVGSGFLGFMIAGIALASENSGVVPVLVWAVLAAAFIVDATLTFFRRLRRGLWREAHRSHAYQRAVQSGWSHTRVTVTVGVLNVLLAVLAAAAMSNVISTAVAGLIALLFIAAAYAGVERRKPFTVESK